MEGRIFVISSIFSFFLIALVVSSPVDKRQRNGENLQERLKKIHESLDVEKDGVGQLEYARYWKELMANNPELAKRFSEMTPEEVAKRFGDQFAHKDGNVRSRIDELQRLNQERLRNLNGGKPPVINRGPYNAFPTDTAKLNTDEIRRKMEEHRRIQEELDQVRRDEFKRYEKHIEDVRKKKLKEMDETQRLKEEQRLEELAKKHKDHERMEHPGGKKQLEDVWNEQDGLKDEKFNPRTFFFLHDKNGDKVLDVYEIEALFMKEIKKVYKEDNNNIMMEEELAEMREHVFGEVDHNRDGVISLEEFLMYTGEDSFNVNDEWMPLEEREKFVVPENMEDYDYDYPDYDGINEGRPQEMNGEHQQEMNGEHQQVVNNREQLLQGEQHHFQKTNDPAHVNDNDKAPDTENQAPDTQNQASNTHNQDPDTQDHGQADTNSQAQNQGADTQNQVPDTKTQVPDTRHQATTTQNQAPDTRGNNGVDPMTNQEHQQAAGNL